MNQELYQQLLEAGRLLVRDENTKNEIRQLQTQIKDNTAAIEAAKKNISAKPKHSTWRTILGIICLIVGCPLTFAGTMALLVVTFTIEVSGGPIIDILGRLLVAAVFFIPFVAPFLAVTIAGIILLLSVLVSTKKHKKKAPAVYEQIKAKNEAENKILEERINQIADEFIEYWNSSLHLLDFLPEDYRTAHAVCFMLKAVKNLRADTLKEAINLYDQELKHLEAMAAAERQRIQNEELLYTMELLNLNMETMNSNQERTNRKLDDISFMQSMQMFDD